GSGYSALIYRGPPSLDGMTQPGCEVLYDNVHIDPDVTHFGKPCVIFEETEEATPHVGVLRSKVSTSKRDKTYQVQLAGTGTLKSVRVAYIALIFQINVQPLNAHTP